MKRSLLLILFSLAGLEAFEFKSTVDLMHVEYAHSGGQTEMNGNVALSGKNSFAEGKMTLIYLYSERYKEKRYLRLNELYVAKNMREYRVEVGKRLLYWGELEGYNITDVFNQKNYLFDPFDKSAKLGSWSGTVSRYFGDNVLEAGVKFYEEDMEFGNSRTPYYPLPLTYSSQLNLQEGHNTPTWYISYALTGDAIVESESRIIFWHGYDMKRNFIAGDYGQTVVQYAYRVNKALLLSHIVYEDMIFKLEGSYTDVINYAPMSDYWQLGLGAEKSFYDIAGADVTLYAEYYRYGYNDEGKVEHVDISEIYDDDLFLATRIIFNDTRSSEVKIGMLYDLEKSERVFKAEAKMRLLDRFVLHAEWLRFIPKENSLLSTFDDHTRTQFGISYSF
ncbi:MAG: hypothetical protein L3J47_07965 [Sulfurovum sp.]|nr:hypothetical protein [Sulfurovum sp.]